MNNVFPCITLYQPWAFWIMEEWKKIETRTHARFACLKGRSILIHAGQTTDKSDIAVNNPYLTEEQLSKRDGIINGYILGCAFVYDFMALSDIYSKASLIDCGTVERYGLFLEGIHKFEKPIPVKGEMGIWYFDLEKREKVKKPQEKTLTLF